MPVSLFVCPSVRMKQRVYRWFDFSLNFLLVVLLKSVDNNQFRLKLDKNKTHENKRYGNISLNNAWWEKNFR
jgi:hypothetical protein